MSHFTVQGKQAYAYSGSKAFAPSQPTMVLIHGALNDHSVWALQSRYFAHHGFNVLAVDLPGHMRSEGPALESVEAYADWVIALCAVAGASRAALVGHSMGSLIALEIASRHGSGLEVSHLALIGTAAPMTVSPALLQTSLDDPEKAMRMVCDWSLSTTASKPSAPGPGSWLHGGSLRLMQAVFARGKAQGNLFHQDFLSCNAYARALEAAAALRCPVEFILGAKDMMTTPKTSVALQGVVAKALQGHQKALNVSLLPCGHSLMAEAPDGVLMALRGLLSRT